MHRVAIIGAGPGGLIAAYKLQMHCPVPLRITLFEAMDRVGGKIVTRKFSTAPVPFEAGVAELYGYWMTGRDPLRSIVDELGLEKVRMFGGTVILGDHVMRNFGDIKRHFGRRTLRELKRFRKFASAHLSPRDYYNAGWPEDNKHPLARRSFDSVLHSVRDKIARDFIAVAAHSDLATEPHLTDGLFGVENCLVDNPNYIRLYSLAGGLEQLPQALAGRLRADIRLRSKVVAVSRNRSRTYRIFVNDENHVYSHDADFVLVALPNYWLPFIEWQDKGLHVAIHRHFQRYDCPAHYLKVCVLFKRPFWRDLIQDSYFQSDAFGGCCVYDESARSDAGEYGVLSWLISGNAALVLSNFEDEQITQQAMASLPACFGDVKRHCLESSVYRWVGSVSGLPGGRPIEGPTARHIPDRAGNPRLFLIGDYLFDSTINGVTDSADIVAKCVIKEVIADRSKGHWPLAFHALPNGIEASKHATSPTS